jgi:hypothetical protein
VVSRIPLDAIPGHHKGAGAHTTTKLLLDPASVTAQKLTFSSESAHVTTMLYELDDDSVAPNWFGVAVPDGVTDFTKPIIYFHPTPNQGPYQDADYKAKVGTNGYRDWRELFEYVDRLGHQLAGAVNRGATMTDQIVILPFMTTASAGSAGILPANWHAIVTDILMDVRAVVTGVEGPLAISDVVVASFSNGTSYSREFRNRAADLAPLLQQVWDFDGSPAVTSGKPVIRYDQSGGAGPTHLSRPRWDNIPQPLPAEEPPLGAEFNSDGTVNGSYVHHLIRDFMFLDAVTRR